MLTYKELINRELTEEDLAEAICELQLQPDVAKAIESGIVEVSENQQLDDHLNVFEVGALKKAFDKGDPSDINAALGKASDETIEALGLVRSTERKIWQKIEKLMRQSKIGDAVK